MKKIELSDKAVEALNMQLHRFKEKFGREPGPGDPIFFDPDKDEPTPIDEEEITRRMVKVMRQAGIHPSLIYAFEKTGLMVNEKNLHLFNEEDMAEWDYCLDEWWAEEEARKTMEKKEYELHPGG